MLDKVGKAVAPVVGALTAGRRKGDGLWRLGFAAAAFFALLRSFDTQLAEDRKLRTQHQQQMVELIRQQTVAITSLQKATEEHLLRTRLLDQLVQEQVGQVKNARH